MLAMLLGVLHESGVGIEHGEMKLNGYRLSDNINKFSGKRLRFVARTDRFHLQRSLSKAFKEASGRTRKRNNDNMKSKKLGPKENKRKRNKKRPGLQ